MRGLPKTKFTKEYFEQFRTTPLKLSPFDPNAKKIANRYIEEIQNLLFETKCTVRLRGSTAFEILGKGDIDIAVYSSEKEYSLIKKIITREFVKPVAEGIDFTAYEFAEDAYKIEISLMKGIEARVDEKLTDFMLNNRHYIKEYEKLKKKYCFSKREYLIQRNMFFSKVVKLIPD